MQFMEKSERPDLSDKFRLLPSVDAVMRTPEAETLGCHIGSGNLTRLARNVISDLRRDLGGDKFAPGVTREELVAEASRRLAVHWSNETISGLRRVINATGVVIHTNLGRAPLSDAARQALINEASGYCNLEYDLRTGKRGRRGARAEELLASLTGAESALIVNNCAAATFLVLTVLAAGGEVVISRGELVEIGGDFRIPDVLVQSGATLREVGTTNRTKLTDYKNAVSDQTRLFLKVHPSNYRVIGFTAAPEVSELVTLAHAHGLLVYEDAGSGALFDLTNVGLGDEPVIPRSIAAGVDVVSFSGDKLLGGVQSGLIVGRRDVIERIRRHPLYRALRVDKLIYAALEATLFAFSRETAVSEIPVLRMLSLTAEEIRARSAEFVAAFDASQTKPTSLKLGLIVGQSVVGGGSAPGVQPATTLISVSHPELSATTLEAKLRSASPPVIGRIENDTVVFDLRTVAVDDEAILADVLQSI